MAGSIWHFSRRNGDDPMVSAQPTTEWPGMARRPLDRRYVLVSLLLHAAIGVLLLIVFPGGPLRPVAESPPLTVIILPPDLPPAAPSVAVPRPPAPPPRRRAVPPAPAPLPAAPAEPVPTVIQRPEIHATEVQPAAPATPPSLPTLAPSALSSIPLPGAVQGARAIYRPTPIIPDALREEALSAAAVARFHIAVDGTTTVELVTPTRDPRLNRVLLEALKAWRFFPAMRDGQPVESTQDLPIAVEVK